MSSCSLEGRHGAQCDDCVGQGWKLRRGAIVKRPSTGCGKIFIEHVSKGEGVQNEQKAYPNYRSCSCPGSRLCGLRSRRWSAVHGYLCASTSSNHAGCSTYAVPGPGRVTARPGQSRYHAGRGVTPVYTWLSARSAARSRPLDAMLIDASSFDTMSDSDWDWLRTQFRDGVVVVGLGVNDDRSAQILGLETLRALAEASPAVDPVGPTGYRLVMRLVLGRPDDVETLERSN